MADITISVDTIGLNAGPFTITDNLGNTLATGVTRAQLLAGYPINEVDDTVTLITVTSSGLCTNSKAVVVDFIPDEINCILARFYLDAGSIGSCEYYILAVTNAEGQARYQATRCDTGEVEFITINGTETFNGCFRSDNPPVLISGSGTITTGGPCSGVSLEYLVNYQDCTGASQVIVLSNQNLEQTVCIKEGSDVMEEGVLVQYLGGC